MAFIKCSGGDKKYAHGTFTASTSSSTTINIGWKPDYLAVVSNGRQVNVYNKDLSTTQFLFGGYGSYVTFTNFNGSSDSRLNNLTDTGFIVNKAHNSSSASYYYFAVKD